MLADQRPAPAERSSCAWTSLGKADIDALLGTRAVARTDHFALHCLPPPMVVSELSTEAAPDRHRSVDNYSADGSRGSATLVPKRHAKRAVTRNLIRRQMREVLRDRDTALPACRLLIRLRAPFDRSRFPAAASAALRNAVRQELTELLARRRPLPCH